MGHIEPLPGSQRPVDAIRHMEHVITTRPVAKLLLVVVLEDAEQELYGFGPDFTPGEFALAGARLSNIACMEYRRER